MKSSTGDIINVFDPSNSGCKINSARQDMINSGVFEFVEYSTYEYEIRTEEKAVDPEI